MSQETITRESVAPDADSSLSSSFQLVAQSTDIHGADNFPVGCQFSPDGLCVLTSTGADSQLRLYNSVFIDDASASTTLHPWKTALSVNGGNAVRSYDWFPGMQSSDPGSCCFVATARNQPIHLYDAYSGLVRATYRAYNALDEMESATITTFDPSGQKLLASGFRTDRTIHVFQVAAPGRQSTILRLGKTRRSSDGQKGLVSSLAYSKGNHIAVGTYAPGSIYVYDERAGQQPSGTVMSGLCVAGHGRNFFRKKRRFASLDMESDEENQANSEGSWLSSAKTKWFHSRCQGGVTQLRFAPVDQYLLYSASRKSNAILAWDLRMLSGMEEFQSQPISGYGSFETANDTNQRLEFDLTESGDKLFVGGQDRSARIYDVKSSQLESQIDGLEDTVNGVSFKELGRQAFLAVATGSRHFPTEDDLDRDVLQSSAKTEEPGYLRLYSMHQPSNDSL